METTSCEAFRRVKNQIISAVKKECLHNGELNNEQSWIDDIDTAIGEGNNKFEISAQFTKSGHPEIILFNN